MNCDWEFCLKIGSLEKLLVTKHTTGLPCVALQVILPVHAVQLSTVYLE